MSRGMGGGEGAHAVLLSNTLSSCGHTEAGTRPGVGYCKKPKDLIVCESEECGHGEGVNIILF